MNLESGISINLPKNHSNYRLVATDHVNRLESISVTLQKFCGGFHEFLMMLTISFLQSIFQITSV